MTFRSPLPHLFTHLRCPAARPGAVLPPFNDLFAITEEECQGMVFLCSDNRYFTEKGILVEHIKAKNLYTDVIQHIIPDTGTLAGSFTFGQVC